MVIESTDAVPTITETASVLTCAARPSVVKESAFVGIPLNHTERPEKMFFYLTMLNLARFLMNDAYKPKEGDTDVQAISAINA